MLKDVTILKVNKFRSTWGKNKGKRWPLLIPKTDNGIYVLAGERIQPVDGGCGSKKKRNNILVET